MIGSTRRAPSCAPRRCADAQTPSSERSVAALRGAYAFSSLLELDDVAVMRRQRVQEAAQRVVVTREEGGNCEDVRDARLQRGDRAHVVVDERVWLAGALAMGDQPAELDRVGESRRNGAPAHEVVLFRKPVRRDVQLDGRKPFGVVREPLALRQLFRIEASAPVAVRLAARADEDRSHRPLATRLPRTPGGCLPDFVYVGGAWPAPTL